MGDDFFIKVFTLARKSVESGQPLMSSLIYAQSELEATPSIGWWANHLTFPRAVRRIATTILREKIAEEVSTGSWDHGATIEKRLAVLDHLISERKQRLSKTHAPAQGLGT